MNIRDVLPRGSSVYAICASFVWFYIDLTHALNSHDPVLPEREWTDGT